MSSVQFSPFNSIFENKAAGTIIIGSPGSGKTFFILNLIFNSIAIMNQRVFAIDPKDDLGVLADILPSKIELIDINNIKGGALNPFKVITNIDTNTLSSLISIICGGLSEEQNTAITPILNDFINKFKRTNNNLSFSDVADYLYANDNASAQAVGTKLIIHRDSKYGALLFEETNNVFSLMNGHDTRTSKIISLHGMDLPQAQTKDLSEEQKFNSGIVFILCKMLNSILSSAEKYPTMFVMDEAHIAFKNKAFSSIIDQFLILGRSLNVPTVLASQKVDHYPPGIEQLIANKFCFRSTSNEALTFLETFFNKDGQNMADFDSIVYQVGNFENGECLFLDSENRSGFFKVVSLLGDVSSNPLSRRKAKKNEEV